MRRRRESVSELSTPYVFGKKKEPSQFQFECAQCVCARGMTSMFKGAPEQQQLVRVDHQDGIAPGPSSSQLGGRGGDANPLDAAVGRLLDGEIFSFSLFVTLTLQEINAEVDNF